jgi:hypothetical protein
MFLCNVVCYLLKFPDGLCYLDYYKRKIEERPNFYLFVCYVGKFSQDRDDY